MSDPLGRVLVLAGGISHERDISLRSGRRLADALLAHGVEVEIRDPDASLLGALRRDRPAVVWPALHGASGEDGAGVCQAIGWKSVSTALRYVRKQSVKGGAVSRVMDGLRK